MTNNMLYEGFIKNIFNRFQSETKTNLLVLANAEIYDDALLNENIHSFNLLKIGVAYSIKMFECNYENTNNDDESTIFETINTINNYIDNSLNVKDCDELIDLIQKFKKEFL